jgi:hypothetical protein
VEAGVGEKVPRRVDEFPVAATGPFARRERPFTTGLHLASLQRAVKGHGPMVFGSLFPCAEHKREGRKGGHWPLSSSAPPKHATSSDVFFGGAF